jgi:hypothetical protein
MKSTILLILILLFSTYVSGQDNVIPDYKGEKESFSKLKDKTIRKEIATFTDAGSKEADPKLKLKGLTLIKSGASFSTFLRDSIYVSMTIGKFHKEFHKIKYIDKLAVKIDNKAIWGTDGELPKKQINSILVIINNDTINIPKSAYDNLYEPGLAWNEPDRLGGTLKVYYSHDKSRTYISMSNSDGAGYYEATLIIKEKKYFGRVLDTGF